MFYQATSEEVREYMRKIGQKGGRATLRKHGKAHYKKMVASRKPKLKAGRGEQINKVSLK